MLGNFKQVANVTWKKSKVTQKTRKRLSPKRGGGGIRLQNNATINILWQVHKRKHQIISQLSASSKAVR